MTTTHDERWKRYVSDYADREKREKEQPCIAELCAQQIIMEKGLPPGTPVAVGIVCPCPRCNKVRL